MSKGKQRKISPKRGGGNLGTFSGVFTPSILTILGIILFLRLGYVVGSAGLGRALVIIALANGISVLTSLSLAAIATNLRVKGGGDYYLISRTLGVEFGGALGVVLFLAQSISIAFYCIGFGEAVAGMLPEGGQASFMSSLLSALEVLPGGGETLPRMIAGFAAAFLFVFAWLGADWATRLQYVVMGILAAALVSFLVGGLTLWEPSALNRNWATPSGGTPFWILFALFFPAVTGFTQGVSMSGDLKDPGRSLPVGTFAAVGLSIIVYLGVAIVFAGVASQESLASDFGAMRRTASVGWLIDAGVIAATLSSGMASFLGAPRILQSVAADRVFPFLKRFATGVGPAKNPRNGVLLAAVITFITIGLGTLNLIAPVVSMFFLISYGLLNYATFYEARANSPSFRPRFRWFDARLSFLGALLCLGAMLAIDPAAGAVAIAILFAIYQYLKRTSGPARWADSSRAYHFQRVREHLLAMAAEEHHPRDWRPQVLAFSEDPPRREQLLRFASWIEGGSGITAAVRLLEGEPGKNQMVRDKAEADLRADIQERGVEAFPLVAVSPDLQAAVQTLVQSFGVGPLRANIVLMNWLDTDSIGGGDDAGSYGQSLRAVMRLGCNVIVLDADKEDWKRLEEDDSRKRRIDVWWTGDPTSRLMLLLAYLMTRSQDWEGASIRVLTSSSFRKAEKAREELKAILEEVRIDADPEVVVGTDVNSMVQQSGDGALVFLPLRLRGNRPVDPFGGPVEDLLTRLPVVAMALAAEDMELDSEPEDPEPPDSKDSEPDDSEPGDSKNSES